MMRSLYSGVAGLRNHQTRMDVIGNNIANVNTAGYKKNRVVFKDAFYQTMRAASAPTAERGGTNPMGVGLGVNLASIDQIHTPAPATATNKTTDMAVDGNGYFIVKGGGMTYYTRAGAFDFDESGKLVSTANGYTVQGYNADENFVINPTGDPQTIDISQYLEMRSRATENMELAGNLDSSLNFIASRNEVQELSFPSVPNGGNPGGQFTLTMGTDTTGLIAVGNDGAMTAANIQAALEQLPSVGAGNVSVTWDQVRGKYSIEFNGTLSNTAMPDITFNTPQITQTTPGDLGITDEVQTLSLGGATSGTYFLNYNGTDSTVINIGDDAATIQTALETIPGLNGNITVADAGDDFTITFDNSMGDVPPITFSEAFTGGTPVITTTTESQIPISVLPVNEIQALNLAASTGGDYTLTYGGVTTVPIAFDADAATILAALEANPALNGNITVTATTPPEAGTNGGNFAIEFINGLAGSDVEEMVITNAPGSTGTVTTSTQGKPAGNPAASDSITTSKEVFDSQGNRTTAYYRFFKYEIMPGSNPGVIPVVEPITSWACDISLDPLFEQQTGYLANADLRSIDISGAVPPAPAGDEKMTRIYNIEFDKNGVILNPTSSNTTFSINRQAPPPGAGTANVTINADFQGITQFARERSVQVASQDGYAAGKMVTFDIARDGTIKGVYDNEQTKDLAQVALRNFQNPAGMKQVGGTLFQETSNSGALTIGVAGQNGLGMILPGSLEMSNVDLSEEFTDMIVTQRGFQANSRIITTSDEMLQELVNLKR